MGIGKAHPDPKGSKPKRGAKNPPAAPEQEQADAVEEQKPTHTAAAKKKLEQQQLEGTGERLDVIHQCAEKLKKLSDDRKAINASVQAVREQVESLGVSKAAFDMAMRYSRMDEEQRQGFDMAYAIVRRALGMPIVTEDLFAADGIH